MDIADEGRRAADLAFARIYAINFCVLAVAAAAVLLSVLVGDGAGGLSTENFGRLVVSPTTLVVLFGLEIVKVVLAKKLSTHPHVFSLPAFSNPVRGDPTRGPWLRRIVLRYKKLFYRVKPYAKVVKSAAVLFTAWQLFAYVTVCFGAPAFTHYRETFSFSALLAVLAVLPTIAVFGPDTEDLAKVYLDTGITGDGDPLAGLLFTNALGAVVGAWLGAFPIPLDWDRPWQAWPITCAIGAVVGNLVAGVWSLIVISKLFKR